MTNPGTGAAALPLQESYAAFFRREYPRMVALAAAISGSRATAEDLAQDAMIRAHRHWDRVSAYDRPGAWVRRVTVNISLSARKRTSAELRRMLRIAEPSTLPEPDVADDRVWRAVGELPGKQRAAIALHYLDDLSTPEIAAILQIAESTVRVHIHRGRRALAAALQDQEVPQ